ncbi:MAG: phosphate transport system substrate-binding protein [Cellvibrionaceae bacterium]|jgi:phosphate transport system substrate-binding protein
MKKFSSSALIAAAVLTLSSTANAARDNISIVGSSTVYPFATTVAEKFGKTTTFKTPTIESTGSGGGAKLFCSGVGVSHPDITNASRRMKQTEFESCVANGVKVVEVLVGFDGIVVANSKKSDQLTLTRKDLFLALAKTVPNPNGSEDFIANPYKTWKDVNASLPDIDIEVLGPPPTSGTRDAFAELAMEGGCKQYPFIKAMKKKDKPAYKAICHTVREDGAYVESGENDNLIVQKLQKNPAALGIFGFSFLEENSSKVQGSLVEGIAPAFDSIADKSYPISRPLYFYVKKNHVGVIPGIEEYIAEFTQESTWGRNGYLADRGMIPLSDKLHAKYSANAKALVEMKISDF